MPFFLTEKERSSIKKENLDINFDMYAVRCLKGVWDQRFYDSGVPLDDILLNKNREEKCFFYKYDEGTTFKAAEELQRIAKEHHQMKKTNRNSVLGLWFAGFALIFNAIVEIIRLIK